jgi:hypothetical protein
MECPVQRSCVSDKAYPAADRQLWKLRKKGKTIFFETSTWTIDKTNRVSYAHRRKQQFGRVLGYDCARAGAKRIEKKGRKKIGGNQKTRGNFEEPIKTASRVFMAPNFQSDKAETQVRALSFRA